MTPLRMALKSSSPPEKSAARASAERKDKSAYYRTRKENRKGSKEVEPLNESWQARKEWK
eukprot:scaffold1188_cov255-Pinguiococcus_pyrenoidosus.AAC.2